MSQILSFDAAHDLIEPSSRTMQALEIVQGEVRAGRGLPPKLCGMVPVAERDVCRQAVGLLLMMRSVGQRARNMQDAFKRPELGLYEPGES